MILGKELLVLLRKNNCSTLIGSLESTEILQKITFKSLCSKNKDADDLLNKYSGIGLQTIREDQKMK